MLNNPCVIPGPEVMSTKNGKKSRNRNRHDDPPTVPMFFKQPALDEIPLPAKPIKKNIIHIAPSIEIEQPIETITIIQDTPPSNNGNSSKDSNSSRSNRSRSNTPQQIAKKGIVGTLNNGNGNDDAALIANGSDFGNGNGSGDNLLSSTDSTDMFMEPLILDSNEPEPELLNLGGGESDSPDLQPQDEQSLINSNKNSPRCSTRRSQTRYIPTPETPHSLVSGGEDVEETLTILNEEFQLQSERKIPLQLGEEPATALCTAAQTSQQEHLLSTPTITITPSTPPIRSSQTGAPSLETSSTHSDTNLSDSTTDNCSTYAVVGSDITRMNIDEQLNIQEEVDDQDDAAFSLPLTHDIAQEEGQENVYAEIGDAKEERNEKDGGREYEFEERPRSREGSIARTLTGRKSIRPGTDYRKYLLERGMGLSGEGSYTSTLGRPSASSSGIKRKTTPTDFSTSTPNVQQLKRRKLDTTPNPTFNWFSHISQSFYNLKNRFTSNSTNININTDLPQTNTTPKLTAYKSKASLEQEELDTVDLSSHEISQDEEEDIAVEDNISLGVEAMQHDTGTDKVGELDESKVKEYADEAKEIPVALEVDASVSGSNKRKSCAIM